jgi:hypothetical protein
MIADRESFEIVSKSLSVNRYLEEAELGASEPDLEGLPGNVWMGVYHPDFRNAIAVDERIKRITEALGIRSRTSQNTSASTRRSRGKLDSNAGRSTASSTTTRVSSWPSSEPAERSLRPIPDRII